MITSSSQQQQGRRMQLPFQQQRPRQRLCQRRPRRQSAILMLVLVLVVVCSSVWTLTLVVRVVVHDDENDESMIHNSNHMLSALSTLSVSSRQQQQQQQSPLQSSSVQSPQRCALLFFGLPRSYEGLVLPSIIQHLLTVNPDCDVFAHAIVRSHETAGRSGRGGAIDPNALFLLQDYIHREQTEQEQQLGVGNHHHRHHTPTRRRRRRRHVAIAVETEDDFWNLRNATLRKYKTERGQDDKLLYFPYKLRDYKATQVDNIIKQWHSIQSVWTLMTQYAQEQAHDANRNHNHYYDRIGMFRNDVYFATPIRVQQQQSQQTSNNNVVIVPNFGLYPINDRMIVGPYEAVQIWATRRFQLLESKIANLPRGLALHSETFLDKIIFPTIQEELPHTVIMGNNNTNNTIVPNQHDPNDICFFRVRADCSLWINDCLRARTPRGGTKRNPKWVSQQKVALERVLARHLTSQSKPSCQLSLLNRLTTQAKCNTCGDTTKHVVTTDIKSNNHARAH